MEVHIKSFDVSMQIKQNGIELEIRSPDGTKHEGDCYVSMTGLVWCRGRTTKPNGIKLTWGELAEILESREAKKAAVGAARSVSRA